MEQTRDVEKDQTTRTCRLILIYTLRKQIHARQRQDEDKMYFCNFASRGYNGF